MRWVILIGIVVLLAALLVVVLMITGVLGGGGGMHQPRGHSISVTSPLYDDQGRLTWNR